MATRKDQRRQAKRKEREKRVVAKARTEWVSDKLLDALEEVDERIARRDYSTAQEILDELEDRWPKHPHFLSRLVQLNQATSNFAAMEQAAGRWVQAAPDDSNAAVQWCWSLAMAGLPLMATHALRQSLEHWPNHPKSAGLREMLTKCEQQVAENLPTMGVGDDERGRQALEVHERIFQALQRGELERVIQLGEAAVRDQVGMTSIWNNLAEAYFHSARWGDALKASCRAAELDATNVIAQFNVVRTALLLGQREAANQAADQMRSLHPERFDFWSKLVEAFVILERYDEALPVAEDAQRMADPLGWNTPEAAELHHAIAVVMAQRGRIDEARTHWQAALKVRPGFSWARQNLEDLRRPVPERNGPFLIPFGNLIPRAMIDRLHEFLTKRGVGVANDGDCMALRRFCDECPGFKAAIPVLLRIGDDQAREIGTTFAKMIRTPELLDALREFALSDRGSDARRMTALNMLSEVGVEVPSPIKFFSNGAWTEVMLVSQEIFDEPVMVLPDHIQSLMDRGHANLTRGDVRSAEQLFREIVALDPTLVSAHNNLAAALFGQGREDEADAVLRQVLSIDENNVFARCNLAHRALHHDDQQTAIDLLKPLRYSRKFHTTEIAALTSVDLELALRNNRTDVARQLLKSLETFAPNDPNLPTFRRRLQFMTMKSNIGKLFSR